ncbi:MAG TPA: DUF4861 family protein, partial [Polyangiaceae bacterium]|nr:DUF4861 family protein [Polyangiaceae bacterium]
MHRIPAILVVAVGSLACACASAPPAATPPLPPAAPVPSASPAPSAAAAPSASATEAPGPAGAGTDVASVVIVNPLPEPRRQETIALSLADVARAVPALAPDRLLVVDAAGATLLSQLVDLDGDKTLDQLVFQVDLAARETRTVKLCMGDRPPAAAADFRVYGRFVRERLDDFAWENDWVAHRVYGPALETAGKDALISSGIDVWVKRVRRLVVNEWFMTDNYHQDHGDGLDAYKVGPSRGCGGEGIWAGGKLAVSRNFTTSRVLANGPLRLVFELDYPAWQAGGARVTETKRVILDAGTLFNQVRSTFSGGAALSVAIGVAKHPGGTVEFDASSAWMWAWEPLNEGKDGNLGCAIVLRPGASVTQQQTEADQLLVLPVKGGTPAEYSLGTAWDRGGRVTGLADWNREVESQSRRLATPVGVTIAAISAP